ncbi:MAG: inositol monophosphatase family protein [Thermoplasmatota archaeon]
MRIGADGDWSKEIDLEAEDLALSIIDDAGLDWNIISEEMGRRDRGSERTLLFDPIDGTYNAVNGLPFYSTSLAIMEENGEIGAGVVCDIPMQRCFYAEKGGGAFLDGERIRTREYVEATAVFSSFLDPETMEENRALFSWPRRGRYFGSISLEVCFVAKGALDLFALFSRVPRITDIAAAHLILKEAGGEHLKIDLDGSWSPYHPGEESDIKGIIAIGDPEAAARMMEISGGKVPPRGGMTE